MTKIRFKIYCHLGELKASFKKKAFDFLVLLRIKTNTNCLKETHDKVPVRKGANSCNPKYTVQINIK